MMRNGLHRPVRVARRKHVVTTLSIGDTIHVGDSVTLTLLAVEGDLIRFGVESSESGGLDRSVLSEGRNEPDLNWWEWN
jgi:hypothetical protein